MPVREPSVQELQKLGSLSHSSDEIAHSDIKDRATNGKGAPDHHDQPADLEVDKHVAEDEHIVWARRLLSGDESGGRSMGSLW